MVFSAKSVAAAVAVLAASAVSAPTASDVARAARAAPSTQALASKKSDDAPSAARPLLATLAQLHTDERVMLDDADPPATRFDGLLSDRVTGTSHALDPRLLGLLRALAQRFGAASGGAGPVRIELVSGFRSPKLNELLRKKGHHVASHSQHSLGHACDFRVVPVGATKAVAPRVVEKEIRALGWDGGVGIYPTAGDWFVHADVGPNRHWVN